jgi:hypothetical protein
VEVFDMTGRKMLQKALQNGNSRLDISALPAGSYIIQATDDTNQVNKRFHKL